MLLLIEAIMHDSFFGYKIFSSKKLKLSKDSLIFHENYSYDIYKIKGLAGHLQTTPLSEASTSQLLGWPFYREKTKFI